MVGALVEAEDVPARAPVHAPVVPAPALAVEDNVEVKHESTRFS